MSCTRWTIAEAFVTDGSKTMYAEFWIKDTLQEDTPGKLHKAFSIEATQLAQDMPVIDSWRDLFESIYPSDSR